jgi:hypothetical protein
MRCPREGGVRRLLVAGLGIDAQIRAVLLPNKGRVRRQRISSDETHPFIQPPTREQLMAGSAKLRRVYKVEAYGAASRRDERAALATLLRFAAVSMRAPSGASDDQGAEGPRFRLPLRSAICRCPRRPKGRSLPRNDPEFGNVGFAFTAGGGGKGKRIRA